MGAGICLHFLKNKENQKHFSNKRPDGILAIWAFLY
jgi:hypothetical protein